MNLLRFFYIILFTIGGFILSMAQKVSKIFYYDVYSTSKNINYSKNLNGLINEASDTIKYELIFDGERGKFKPIYKIDNSQIKKIDFNQLFLKSEGEFFFNNLTSIVENKKESLDNNYLIYYSYDEIKWKLTDEKSIISGYNCRKAVYQKEEYGIRGIKTYTIEVWFTEDVNDNVAPFGLMGLNGLVTKVNFNNNYEAILNKIENTVNSKKIESFKSGKKITLSEFNNILKNKVDEYLKRKQMKSDFK